MEETHYSESDDSNSTTSSDRDDFLQNCDTFKSPLRIVLHPSLTERGKGKRSSRSGFSEFHSKPKDQSRENRRGRGKVFERSADAEPSGDDNRIGRILRSLARENDEEILLKLCSQLQELVLVQENLRYIRYNLLNIGNCLMDVLKGTQNLQVRNAASGALARLGYVADHDLSTFADWILGCYHKEQNEKTCCVILDSLNELFLLDKAKNRIKRADTALLPGLQSILESADTPTLFEAALKPVLMLAHKNPRSFAKYFQDTGDILIGWLIDPSQPAGVIAKASDALKQLHTFWQHEVHFASTLLKQFLEDLEDYTKTVQGYTESTNVEVEDAERVVALKKISSLLNVFAIVAGEVYTARDAGIFSNNFLDSALSKIASCSLEIIITAQQEPEVISLSTETFGNFLKHANKCCSLLVEWSGSSGTAYDPVLELVSIELQELAGNMEIALITSLITLMTKLVRENSTVITMDILRLWTNSLKSLWIIGHPSVTAQIVELLKALIGVKNIPLLIEVYRYIVSELNTAIASLSDNPMAEETVLLLLTPLSELGKSTNLVSMWALEPSLVGLLSGKLHPIDTMKNLMEKHPSLVIGFLRVLHSHAKQHSNFVASSSLVANSTATYSLSSISPSSANLSTIFKLISNCCCVMEAAPPSVVLLILKWATELAISCKPCAVQLHTKLPFQRFLESVLRLASQKTPFDETAANQLQELLKAVFDLPDIMQQGLVMDLIGSCVRQSKRLAGFLEPLIGCPPQIMTKFAANGNAGGLALSSWIDYDVLISSNAFQQFFKYILNDGSLDFAEDSYWFHGGIATNQRKAVPPQDYSDWMTAQAALFCICNKLRTPFGRPQDTFGVIDDAFKRMAKDESSAEGGKYSGLDKLKKNRMMLRFFEFLEKLMFNSFDGSAVAIPAAPKLVRTFFRTNQTTCQEWLNRLSSAALAANSKAGRFAAAVKYGLRLLTLLVNSQRPISAADLGAYLTLILRSLIHLNSWRQIRGLKQWLISQKSFSKIDISFDWIDAAALQAEHKYEKAAETYKIFLDDVSVPAVRSFIGEQILECYASLCDWNSYKLFRADFTGESLGVKFQMTDIMAAFDRMEQFDWNSGSSLMSWNWNSLLNKCHSSIINAAQELRSTLNLETDLQPVKDVVEYFVQEVLQRCSSGFVEDKWLLWFPITSAVLMNGSDVYSLIRSLQKVFRDSGKQNGFSSSAVYMEWLRWMRWYSHLNPNDVDFASRISKFSLAAACIARKEENYRLAESLLIHSLRTAPRELSTLLMNEALKLNVHSPDFSHNIELQIEGAKLLFARGDSEAAVNVLTQSTLCLVRSLSGLAEPSKVPLTSLAKSHVLLAYWCSGKSVTELPASLNELWKTKTDGESHVEILLKKPTEIDPEHPKFWLKYGDFLYNNSLNDISLDDSFEGPTSPLIEACSAYFKFLELQGSRKEPQEEVHVVKVTLRILRLLVRNVSNLDTQLKDVMESGLADTPAVLWKTLTPQLLSLIQHGHSWVRPLVTSLLERMAILHPELLLIPAAVGAAGLAWSWSAADSKSLMLLQGDKEAEDFAAEDVQPADIEKGDYVQMLLHYQTILAALNRVVPQMVTEVQMFLRELRRVVLLWDELWLVTLQHVHPQVEQLLLKLQQQTMKTQTNPNFTDEEKKEIIRENYRIVFKPILHTLRTVAEVTSAEPETPHEQVFAERFGGLIGSSLRQMEEMSCERLQDLWLPFKNILQQLQSISHRRIQLKLTDVSPTLAAFNGTSIPMPGLLEENNSVTVKSVENVISVLPTKTKPKKLTFVGSDGKKYAYLLKGLEDLHLDQRIMQLLSVSNLLLAEDYRARHYAVIPLGPRCGLIQWVEGVTPMFALYKRWLQRQAAVSQKNDSGNPGVAPRPSELFYAKLTPLLEAEGITVDPRQRSQWPKEALRQVYQQLAADTPKDLLSRELWLGSEDNHHWWASTERFGRSCAVMSMIGYIIGLGDRHLDNVLIDLRNGEVVHIDYNVCFEKGRQLRVPEKVPFRLTPNLEHALGPAGTGLSGTFRLSCIDVLQTLRNNRELILTLLEHFIYDPLVDWKAQSGSSESSLAGLYVINPSLASECSRQRRIAERQLTNQLFRLKVKELKPDWLENKCELEAVLPLLVELLDQWLEEHDKLSKLSGEIEECHEELAVILEAGNDKNHIMRHPEQLQQVLLPFKAAVEGEKTILSAWQERNEDCLKWAQLCEVAFASLSANQLSLWRQLVTKPLAPGITGFPLVAEFLVSCGLAGQAQQGQLLEQQVVSLLETQQQAAALVLELLGRYSSIAAIYPSSKKEKHRVNLAVKWIAEILSSFSVDTCHKVALEFQDLLGLDPAALAIQQQNVVSFQVSLGEILGVSSEKLWRLALVAGCDENVPAAELIESKEAIENFLGLHGSDENQSGIDTVKCAVLLEVAELYEKLKSVELDISSGKITDTENDSLIDTLQVNVSVMISLLELLPPDEVKGFFNVLQLLEQVLQDIEDLVLHSSSIILPELLRGIESEDTSVIHISNSIQDLRNINEPMDKKAKWNELGKRDEPLKQGQMLFMGLNGLYEKLENSTAALFKAAKAVKLHKVAEGAAFMERITDIVSTCLDMNLEEALLSSKVCGMEDVFQSCSMFADSFWNRGNNRDISARAFFALIGNIATDWVRDFCCCFASSCAAGVCVTLANSAELQTELPNLEKITQLAEKRKSSHQQPALLSQACAAVNDVKDSRLLLEQILNCRKQQKAQEAVVQLVQQQLAAHAWIHDDLLNVNGASARFQFLLELRQALSLLLSQSPQLLTLHQQITSLSPQVRKRLDWNSRSDASLNQVLADFEKAQETCLSTLQEASVLATTIGGVSSAILHFETLRTRSTETLAYDSTFTQLLSRSIEICTVKENSLATKFNRAELRVAEKVLSETGTNAEWIEAMQKALSERVAALKKQLSDEQLVHRSTEERAGTAGADLRSVLSSHHHIVSDLRSVLKNMARAEGDSGQVTDYLKVYQEFSELGTGIARSTTSKEYEAEKIKQSSEDIQKLGSIIDSVYNGVLDLCSSDETQKRTAPTKVTGFSEQGTATAKSIWHRVRLKLEGRDPDPETQLSVEEQVDELISQALDIDSLALLYEGWTPWV